MKFDVVPIRVGDKWLLVRAGLVSEFLSSTTWLSVPGSTSLVPGIMTWRGRAIPVLDLPRALNLGVSAPIDERSRVMVVDHATGAIAIPVDGAREVTSYDEEVVRQPHVSNMPYTTGEIDASGTVLPLIELEQLLNEVGKTGC